MTGSIFHSDWEALFIGFSGGVLWTLLLFEPISEWLKDKPKPRPYDWQTDGL
jgi:hypothetical protein